MHVRQRRGAHKDARFPGKLLPLWNRERACMPELECSHFRPSALADLTSPFLAAALGWEVRAASERRARQAPWKLGRPHASRKLHGRAGPGALLARSRGHEECAQGPDS